MMRSAITAAVLVIVLLGGEAVMAAPGQGASELQVSGGFFHSQGSDDGSLNADLSYGYYFTPGWQLGLRQALNYNFVDDRRDFWVATTSPFLKNSTAGMERTLKRAMSTAMALDNATMPSFAAP